VLVELTPVALPDDPLDVAAAVVDRAADGAPVEPLLDTEPELAVPDDDPEAAAVVDEAVVVVVLAGVVEETAVVATPVGRVTAPFCVTVPGVAVVCAAAGNATATESNIA
jgi:hypothetical protein